MRMIRATIAAMGLACLAATPGDVVYSNDFEKAAEGSVPDEFMVLNGSFGVKKEGGNSYLELPGEPLESFAFLAGPDEPAPNSAGARIWADKTGKRFPEFGVGLRGAGGYKLWLMPIINELQIRKGDEVIAREAYAWTPGKWTTFRMRLRSEGDKHVLEGKVWGEGAEEPKEWMIASGPVAGPAGGRASVWGLPFSGKPIRFDDVGVGK